MTIETKSAAEFKIRRARAAMITSQRFYGYLAMQLGLVEDTDIETMETDGKHIFYNPEFVERLSMDELAGVIAHEVMHVANLHHTRMGSREPKRWNEAADYAINPYVLTAGFKLPQGVLIDPLYQGMGAERIYPLLPAKEGNGGGMGIGGVRPAANANGTTPSPAEMKQIEADTQVAVTQANNLANAAGQGSVEQERLTDNVKKAQIDWHEELRRFYLATGKSDYDWSRPNRRFISSGIYLPRLAGVQMGDLVVALDASYSTMVWIPEFCGQIKAMVEDTKPRRIYVLHTTDRVVAMDEYTPEDFPDKLPVHGVGGTDFRPAFEWVEQNGIAPDCFIYLTDLYGATPKHAPDYPVIWACTTEQQPPWGELVQVRH